MKKGNAYFWKSVYFSPGEKSEFDLSFEERVVIKLNWCD